MSRPKPTRRTLSSAPSALLDRRLALAVAARITGPSPRTSARQRREIGENIREVCALAEQHVQEFTGWHVPVGAPPEVVNRIGWVEANLAAIEPLMEQAASRLKGPAAFAGGALSKVMSVQMGLLFGYLSRRVIAQYDLLGGERLLFVGPNIVATEERAGVDARSFRTWVAVHEVTHRLQFGGVDWLRPALEGMIDRSMTMLSPQGRSPVDIVQRLRASVARSSLVPALQEALLTEDQRELLRDAQALMSSVEGHASFVMDRVGARLIEDVEGLRKQVERSKGRALGPEKVLQRAIGFEAKQRQYTDGKSFFDRVANQHGDEAVREAWSTREHLPTIEELKDPGAWAERVLGV